MKPTFSYAILVNNEVNEIDKLLNIISKQIDIENDEIVILQDDNCDIVTKDKIKIICDKYNVNTYETLIFKGNFAEHKNHLNSLCTKSWIVNLDADEYISDNFNEAIRTLIESNDDIDTIKLPRINIIKNASDDFLLNIQTKIPGYGWSINDRKHINFPDYQERIYKNTSGIVWKGNVHEIISGANNQSAIPPDYEYEDYFIIHEKDINKQFLQNYKYLNIMEDLRFKTEYDTFLFYKDYSDVEFNCDINSKYETTVITTMNDDYSYDELSDKLINIQNRVIYITSNYQLYLYLQSISSNNPRLEPYFIGIEEFDTSNKSSDFFWNTKKILGDDIFRFHYTINYNNRTAIIRNLFNLKNNFIII